MKYSELTEDQKAKILLKDSDFSSPLLQNQELFDNNGKLDKKKLEKYYDKLRMEFVSKMLNDGIDLKTNKENLE